MTIQPKPSKIIFKVVTVKNFYRIRKSVFYSGDEGNPPLVKLLNLRTNNSDWIRGAIARCARGKVHEGYCIRFDGEKGEWICELDLEKEG